MKLFSVYSDMTVKSENFVFLYSWLIIAGVIVFQQQQKKTNMVCKTTKL